MVLTYTDAFAFACALAAVRGGVATNRVQHKQQAIWDSTNEVRHTPILRCRTRRPHPRPWSVLLEPPGSYDEFGFADGLGLLLDKEADACDSRAWRAASKEAELRWPAVDVDFRSPDPDRRPLRPRASGQDIAARAGKFSSEPRTRRGLRDLLEVVEDWVSLDHSGQPDPRGKRYAALSDHLGRGDPSPLLQTSHHIALKGRPCAGANQIRSRRPEEPA